MAALKAVADLSDEAWRVRQIKLRIEARTDENVCRRIVKHLFDLDSRADAPNVSRYEKAVLWIHDNCPEDASAPEIVRAIKDAGGLDKVIDLQRLAKLHPEGGEHEGDNVRAEADAGGIDTELSASKSRRSNLWTSLNRAKPLKSFAMKLHDQSNGLVLLVGRYSKGKVGILKAAPLSDDGLASIAEFFDTVPAAGSGKKPKSAAPVTMSRRKRSKSAGRVSSGRKRSKPSKRAAA